MRLLSFPWRDRLQPWFVPAIVALLAWLSIMSCLDPGGSYPNLPEGPGLTVDEIFNVQQGVVLVEAVRTYHVGLFEPRVLREVFSPPLHLPDHPPLGRFWLGVHHQVMWWLAPPHEPDGPFVVACARSGSATAFALTVLLVGCFASMWYGRWAGLIAALGWATLPRAFGHAHLAALETCMGLAFTTAVLSVAHTWSSGPPSWRTATWTGVLFGLALLTKIQAIFIPIPLIVWALWRWKQRALFPLAVWGGVGLLVFFAGWPWLWLDPFGHLAQYFGGTANRAELSVWLWGQHYTDRTVPRYYAALSFFWITELKLFGLGLIGFVGPRPLRSTKWQTEDPPLVWTPRESLLALEFAFPLLVFSLPGVPVYDAERLWLPAGPTFAVFAGRGAQILWQRFGKLRQCGAPLIAISVAMWLLMQWHTLSTIAPCYLSHYGGMTFGLEGAANRGQELNYWGDAVTRELLEQVAEKTPRGATIAVSPVLHQFQVEDLLRQSPILRRHAARLVPFDPQHYPADYVLLFRRQADLPPELRTRPQNAELLAEVKRHGVQLAALYRWQRNAK